MGFQGRLCAAAALASVVALKNADACSCIFGSSLCDKFEDADIVLRGTVTAREEGEDINDDTVYDITTTEIFKGEADEEYAVSMSFDLVTGGNSALCGIFLEVGQEYVIDLFRQTFTAEDRLYAAGSCGLVTLWGSVEAEDRALLRSGCDGYDPCEGACDEFQECLLFTASYYAGATEYYCSDTCDPGTCERDETCELLYTPCAGPGAPCPPVAVCTEPEPEPEPVADCFDAPCEEHQECLIYEEGTLLEESYCADTCAPGTCGDEQSCSLEDVQCVRTPCPPIAVCTDAPTPAPLTEPKTVGVYEYVGCFKDTREERVLGFQYDSPEMTTEVCLNHCSAVGAAYAATQYGYECWCYLSGRSDFDRHDGVPVCDMPCHGDEEEICGGNWAFSLYELDWPAAPVDDPEYLDCYRDDGSDRVMADMITRDDMTPAVCRAHCLDKGAHYYGTQYSSECWCGTSNSISDYDRHGEGVCHLACTGEPDVACGGYYAFDLFKYSEVDDR